MLNRRTPRTLLLTTLAFGVLAPGALAQPCQDCEEPPPPVNHAPSAVITGDTGGFRGQDLVLTNASTDIDDDGLTWSWDLDGDGTYGDNANQDSVVVSYATLGTKKVGLRVSDGRLSKTTAAFIAISNRAPVASFDVNSEQMPTGGDFTLTSTASDPDGDALYVAWDLDGEDGFEFVGATATVSYATPGTRTVRMLVDDGVGGYEVKARQLTAVNRAPLGTIGFGPAAPQVGDAVTFTSAGSTDPDGTIASRAWDTDNDGAFDDGTGETAEAAFATAGEKTVKLKLVDDFGGESVTTKTVTVKAKPTPGNNNNGNDNPGQNPGNDNPGTDPGNNNPGTDPGTKPDVNPTPQPQSPVAITTAVSKRFKTTRKGTKVVRLAVTPAAGTTVTVTCKGKGCTFSSKAFQATGVKVDLKGLFSKRLKKGAVITVAQARAGAITRTETFKVARKTVKASVA